MQFCFFTAYAVIGIPGAQLVKKIGYMRGAVTGLLTMMVGCLLFVPASQSAAYVYNPSRAEGRVGGGNTHAWVRIFLPGSGWVEFDPTNGIVGNRGLLRVAVARDPYQALPLSGTWSGFPASYLGMQVEVDVRMTAGEKNASKRVGEATNSRLAGKPRKH